MGFLLFLCIFSITLINTNVLFAMDGMVNHTYVDSGVTKNNGLHRNCIKEENVSSNQGAVADGPFPWDDKIEALVNSMVSSGYIIGTLISLISYDYLRARFVFAVAIAYAGFLNIITPFLTWKGGYLSLVVLRFFSGMYSSITGPAVPALILIWFTPNELYRMNSFIFLGRQSAQIFFSVSGNIIEQFGWEFLFYFPGILALIFGIAFFIFMTDDPIDNRFLSVAEKENIVKKQKRKVIIPKELDDSIIIFDEKNGKSTPWIKIFSTPMFWIATIQMFSHSWGAQVTVMCMKKYLLEMHGYTIKEASRMVTLPTNIAQICFSVLGSYIAETAQRSGKVNCIYIRRISAIVCSLAACPFILLTFLPCEFFADHTGVLIFQIWSSIRVVGDLAGYATLRDISKTYYRQMACISLLIYGTLPGIIVPHTMGWFGTSSKASWRNIFILNSLCMVAGNWIYVYFVNNKGLEKTDPHHEKKEDQEKNA